MENPHSAAAVRATLAAVTFPVPRFFVRASLYRLEIMVPAEMIMERIPAKDTATPNSPRIMGHAAPRRASGRLRLINAT